MESLLDAEVCIVGGGPAGATIARRLALLGHDVCLLEAEAFPRSHVGEALAPGILPLLDVLDVRERVEAAAFLRSNCAIVRWTDEVNQVRSSPGTPGFQVDRGRFDQLLVDAAREVGVRVMQPARAAKPEPRPKGWIIPVRAGGKSLQVVARFLVDAAGRRGVLTRTKQRSSVPTIALYSHWANTSIRGGHTLVEAGPDAWYWGAPLPDGTFSSMVFVDAERNSEVVYSTVEERYRALLARSVLLQGCLYGTLVAKVKVCDASSRRDTDPVNTSFIKVGEASFSIDPLSSQGVQAAMLSGIQGAIVVHTILTRPEYASTAMEFYKRRQIETVERHCALSAQQYATQRTFADRAFWQRRASLATSEVRPQTWPPPPDLASNDWVKLSDEASLVYTPCITGDIVSSLRALAHPALGHEVAYLGTVEVAPLLDKIGEGSVVEDILQQWSRQISLQLAEDIMRWLWARGILVSAARSKGGK